MEQEPPKVPKATKSQQKKGSIEGASIGATTDRRSKVPTWNSSLVLDGAPLSSSYSIWEFQQGRAGYVVYSMKQALLLLWDMEELKNLKKHEVFLTLKRDLAMVHSDIHIFFKHIFSFPFPPLPPNCFIGNLGFLYG